MKSKKYHTVGRFPKYNIKIVKRGTIITFNTHIHERSLSLDICTAIKSGGVKLVLKA
jgi:histidinol phosphatase-like PHP family hydrolase